MELDPAETYLLTIPQVAHMLALKKSSAYQLAQHEQTPFGPGGIPVIVLGDKIKRCPMADVVEYLRRASRQGNVVSVSGLRSADDVQ